MEQYKKELIEFMHTSSVVLNSLFIFILRFWAIYSYLLKFNIIK